MADKEKRLDKVIGCRLSEDEEQAFCRIANYLNMSGSELMRWFVQRAIEAERVIKQEIMEKGVILPSEAFLARMDGHLTEWFREAFISTNLITKPEEIEAVGFKLLKLASLFRGSLDYPPPVLTEGEHGRDESS